MTITKADLELLFGYAWHPKQDEILTLLANAINAAAAGDATITKAQLDLLFGFAWHPKSHEILTLIADAINAAAVGDVTITREDLNRLFGFAWHVKSSEILQLLVDAIAEAAAAQAGGGSYTASAVHFDGATQLIRTSAFAGAADSPTGVYSTWVKIPAVPDPGGNFFATSVQLTGNSLPSHDWTENNFGFADGTPSITLATADFASFFFAYAETPDLRDGAWHNILWTWNMNFAPASRLCQCAVDGVPYDVEITDDIGVAFSVDWTSTASVLGADGFGDDDAPRHSWTGDQAEQFLSVGGAFIDLETPANIAQFIAAGKPVDLLTSGAPANPLVYINAAAATAHLNTSGTGGAFTVGAGALTDATTSPSD